MHVEKLNAYYSASTEGTSTSILTLEWEDYSEMDIYTNIKHVAMA